MDNTRTGIATAAASVREAAKPQPIALGLDELGDRIGALEVTISALTERLSPILRDDSYDPTPEAALIARDEPDVDTRSELTRRLDSFTRAIAGTSRHVDRLINRLDV